jgi:hypothetical protein
MSDWQYLMMLIVGAGVMFVIIRVYANVLYGLWRTPRYLTIITSYMIYYPFLVVFVYGAWKQETGRGSMNAIWLLVAFIWTITGSALSNSLYKTFQKPGE